MGQWTYARIGRVDANVVHCVFCNRPLRSGRLIVLSDQLGNEAYAGKSCAHKHLGAPTERLLDLSKIAMLAVIETKPATTQKSSVSCVQQTTARAGITSALPMDEATRYLTLRSQHMVGFTGNITQRLRDIINAHGIAGALSEDERRYIERLMANAASDKTIYSLANVEHCVATAYWLRLAIAEMKAERRDFLERMLGSLCESWRLTAKQIDAVNRWGEGVRKTLPAFPILDPGLFEGVCTPRYTRKSE